MRRDDTDERDTDPALPVYTPFGSYIDAAYARALLALHDRERRGEQEVQVPDGIRDWFHANHLTFAGSMVFREQMWHFIANHSSYPPDDWDAQMWAWMQGKEEEQQL